MEGEIFERLFDGLEGVLDGREFTRRAQEVVRRASDRIVEETRKGKIVWKRDLKNPLCDYFVAEVMVQNAKGEDIKLPATILYTHGFDRNNQNVCLHLGAHSVRELGDEYALCIVNEDILQPLASYTGNAEFRELVENMFHIKIVRLA